MFFFFSLSVCELQSLWEFVQSGGYEALQHTCMEAALMVSSLNSPVACRSSSGVLGDEGEKRSAGGTLPGREMKTGLCWMLIILLGCGLSEATPSKCSCDDESIIYFVPENGNISVPCPNVSGVDLVYYLHKDKKEIYNDTHRETSHGWLDVKLDKNGENKTVGFILTKATTESLGTYVCKVMRKFPPPYTKESGPKIQLLDKRSHFQSSQPNCSNNSTERQDSREIQSYLWIWITVVALLSTYSLAITALALVNWMKLKRVDCQSDYINTKPRANKKKRGVQNPIPRY